jgi:hypothetical protein
VRKWSSGVLSHTLGRRYCISSLNRLRDPQRVVNFIPDTHKHVLAVVMKHGICGL